MRDIFEGGGTGLVEPVPPGDGKAADRYQTKPARERKRSRWQSPPAPAPKPATAAISAKPAVSD